MGEDEIDSHAELKPATTSSKNLEGFAASVELPEGHQLVIGELPPGTVVEVATWQGTGRPNESTNRFLLSASGSGLQRRERSKNPLPQLEKGTEPSTRPAVSAGSVATDSFLGLKSFGVDSPREGETSMNPRNFSSALRAIFASVSVVAITSLTLLLLGFGAVVPTRGIDTALGSSTSALVIYKKSPSVAIGEPTVAERADSSLIFGPSNSFDNNSIQIQTSGGQEVVPLSEIRGRAFLAIPLIGWLLRPILG